LAILSAKEQRVTAALRRSEAEAAATQAAARRPAMPAATDRGKSWSRRRLRDDGGETDWAETAVPRSPTARETAGQEAAVAAAGTTTR
jgi:hypothetical protein